MKHVGKLLIANPTMRKDNPFSKSVVYIYSDCPNAGTVGVVLNRPSETTVQQLAFDQKISFPSQERVYMGGPVNRSAMILLHTDDWQSKNTAIAGANLKLSSDNFMLLKMSTDNLPAYWRLFVGLSTWAPGQLAMEIGGHFPYNQTNQWLTIDGNEAIIFENSGEAQWEQALQVYSNQKINSWF